MFDDLCKVFWGCIRYPVSITFISGKCCWFVKCQFVPSLIHIEGWSFHKYLFSAREEKERKKRGLLLRINDQLKNSENNLSSSQNVLLWKGWWAHWQVRVVQPVPCCSTKRRIHLSYPRCGIKAIILRVKVGWSSLDCLGTPAQKMKAISDSVVLEEFSSNTLDLHDQHQQFAKWNLFGLCWEYSLGFATCQRHEKIHVPSNIPLNSTMYVLYPFSLSSIHDPSRRSPGCNWNSCIPMKFFHNAPSQGMPGIRQIIQFLEFPFLVSMAW